MIDKQLKAMMDKKGLTLEKLSMLSNVPIETIRNIIYRRARNPRVDTLLALSRTLDVSMESLMGESPREEEEQLLFAYRESGEHGKKFIRAIAEIEALRQAGGQVRRTRNLRGKTQAHAIVPRVLILLWSQMPTVLVSHQTTPSSRSNNPRVTC